MHCTDRGLVLLALPVNSECGQPHVRQSSGTVGSFGRDRGIGQRAAGRPQNCLSAR